MRNMVDVKMVNKKIVTTMMIVPHCAGDEPIPLAKQSRAKRVSRSKLMLIVKIKADFQIKEQATSLVSYEVAVRHSNPRENRLGSEAFTQNIATAYIFVSSYHHGVILWSRRCLDGCSCTQSTPIVTLLSDLT